MANNNDRKQTLPGCILLALGAGLFAGCVGLLGRGTGVLSDAVVRYYQLVSLFSFLAEALLFSDGLPPLKKTLNTTALFVLIFILGIIAVPVIADSTVSTIILYATATLFGIAISTCLLLCAWFFTCFPSRTCTALFAWSFLASFLLLFIGTAAEASLPVILSLLFISICALLAGYLLLERIPPTRFSFSPESRQPGPDRTSFCFPAARKDWTLLFTSTAVFAFLYGVSAKISTVTCSPFTLDDTYTGMIVALVVVLVVAYLCLFGAPSGYLVPLLFVVVCYVVGALFFSYSCDYYNPLGGALIRSGFDCGRVLLLVLLAREVSHAPRKAFLWFGLFGLCSHALPGEIAGDALLGLSDVVIKPEHLVFATAQAIFVWVCILAFILLLGYRFAGSTEALPQLSAFNKQAFKQYFVPPLQKDISEPVSDIPAGDIASFSALSERVTLFARTYRLTQRETEVLVETLHGLSRAGVAQKLFLSPETVKDYLGNIYRKAGVSSKQELIQLIESETFAQR